MNKPNKSTRSKAKGRKLPSVLKELLRARKSLQALVAYGSAEDSKHGQGAAQALAYVLIDCLNKFETLCLTKPHFFREIAAQSIVWPVLYHNHPEIRAQTRAFLDEIGFAEDWEWNCRGKSFSLNTPTNRIVCKLLDIAMAYRDNPEKRGLKIWKAPGWLALTENAEARLLRWSREVAPTLPRLSRATFREWANKTDELLMIWYGDEFQNHSELQAIVTHCQETNKSGGIARGRQRSMIRRALLDAWRSVSPHAVER